MGIEKPQSCKRRTLRTIVVIQASTVNPFFKLNGERHTGCQRGGGERNVVAAIGDLGFRVKHGLFSSNAVHSS